MRVLIVEDEPNLGRQLRSTLEGAGYAIDQAMSGEKARPELSWRPVHNDPLEDIRGNELSAAHIGRMMLTAHAFA